MNATVLNDVRICIITFKW